MDLDFGLLQQINADIDGFPVRFDEDMDLLDLDTAFQGPVPGSFQDFANWLADTSGTVASTRNPLSTQPNVGIQDQSNMFNQPAVHQQRHEASKADITCPAVSEQQFQQQIGQHGNCSPQQQQQQASAGFGARTAAITTQQADVMRQNSTHSVASVHSLHSQPSPMGHRPPAAHDSFRSQPSGSLPDSSVLLQQQQQQQQQQAAAAASAALSAAAGKAQQLLMSASSGFQAPTGASAAAAAAPATTAGFLAQPLGVSFGGNFPAAGFSAISPHQGANVLLSPHGAVLQPTLLIGGGGSAHPAMAAMQNPFAAAAASLPGFAASGVQGLGVALGLGGQASLGHVQGIALGQQGYALHNSALHSLVGHGVLKHGAFERQQKVRKRNTVASLEAELSEKLSQLQLLSAENEMLKLRAGVLEATVQNREDQMRVVWEHGPPTFPIDCPEGTPLPGQQQQQGEEGGQPGAAAAAADGSCGYDQQQKQQQKQGLGIAVSNGSSAQLASMWDDDTAVAATAAAAAAAVVAPQMPTTPSAKAEPATSAAGTARTASNCSNASAAAAAAAAGTVVDSPSSSSNCAGSGGSGDADNTFDAHTALLPLPQQKDSLLSIKRMTDVDVLRHWKIFLQEVTSALVQLQREESAAAAVTPAAGSNTQQQQEASSPAAAASAVVTPAEQRVRDLVDKYCYLVRTSQTLNPSAYCRLFGRHLDTGETLPYNDNHWRNVVAVLGLSKDQVTHILACAELYFSSRAKLQAEQRALQAQLKSAELTPLDLAGGDADNPLRPWLERLGSNLKREHNLRIMLNSYVWGRIFTHVQKAKAAVYSHPLYVDIHALVCVMCEDALAAAGAPRGSSGTAQQQQQQQQHIQQQQQQFAAAYAACQQQQQQQQQQQHMAGFMQYMSGHAMV